MFLCVSSSGAKLFHHTSTASNKAPCTDFISKHELQVGLDELTYSLHKAHSVAETNNNL